MIEKHLRAGTTADRIKYLMKDMALYGAASALAPIVGLIAVPLLTRRLTTSEYGAFELITAYVAVAAIVGGMGQDSAFARYYYEHNEDHERRRIIAQAFASQGLASLLIMLSFLLFGRSMLSDARSIANFPLIIIYAALSVPMVVGFNFTRNVLKWTFLRTEYVVASFLYSALVLGGYAVFVAVLHWGTLGAILAQGLAGLAITVGGLWLLRKTAIGRPDWSVALPMIKYGLPFVLLGVLSQGLRTLDKTILTRAQGLEAAAVYAVGYKIASLILIIESTFNMAWGPVAMAIYKEPNSGETYNVALNALACILSLAAAGMAFGSRFVVAIVAPPAYARASLVVKILCVGLVIQSLAGISAVGIELAKKTHLRLVSWAGGIGTAAALMVLLAPRIGMYGVAIGVSAGFITESVIRTLCAYAVYPLRFDMRYAGACLLVLIVLMAGGEWLPLNGVPLIGLEALAFLLFAAVSLNTLRIQAFQLQK